MLLPHLFNRTQFGYWKKSLLDYNTFWILTILLGWLAIDQLYLRSPITFLLKLIGNIFLFSIPYIYDVLQVSLNQDKVKLFGSSMPVVGQVGAGAGMFYKDVAPLDTYDEERQWNFMKYAFILFFTGLIGGDSFFLADNVSGLIRLFSTISFIGIPIALVWWLFKLYEFFWKTNDLLDYNWAFFGAPKPDRPIPKCPGTLEQITIWVLTTSIAFLENIPGMGIAVSALTKILNTLKSAYGLAVDVTATGLSSVAELKKAMESMSELQGFQQAVAEKRADIASASSEFVPQTEKRADIASASSKFVPTEQKPEQVSTQIASPTEQKPAVAQQGGARDTDYTTYAVGGSILLVVASGIYKFISRLRQNGREEHDSKIKDDSPPQPRSV
jgi:hypothetical protein